jgi:deoxyribonuclease-4
MLSKLTNNDLKIGSHMTIERLSTYQSYNLKTAQIFLSSPKIFNLTRINDISKNIINNATKYINVYVHSRYVINLCRDKSYRKHTHMINVSINDINVSSQLGCSGVVFHMGKFVDMDINLALNNMLNNIINIIDNTREHNATLILETSAGVGSEVCYTIQQLKSFITHIPKKYMKHIRFCIDTAHIWASGYNISSFQGMYNYINEFNESIGWKYVTLIHLNDSKVVCDSRSDKHADVGKGLIWNTNKDGLALLLFICKLTNKDVIFETPSSRHGEYLSDLDIVNSFDYTNFLKNKQIIKFIKLLI